MSGQALAKVVKTVVELPAAQKLARLLLGDLSARRDLLPKVAKTVVEATLPIATSAADGNISQTAFHAHGLLGEYVPQLESLLSTLNGDATTAQKTLFGQIINSAKANHGEITAAEQNDLFSLLNQFAFPSQNKKNEHSVTVLLRKKLRQRNALLRKLTDTNPETGGSTNQRTTRVGDKKVTGKDVSKDAEVLTDCALGILTDELTKADSIPHIAWKLGLKPKDAPKDLKALPSYLKGKIYGENAKGFRSCIENYLWYLKGKGQYPDLDAHKLNDVQKKAFHALRASIKVGQWVPQGVIETMGNFKTFSAPVVGFLRGIPGLGPYIEWAVRMFNEYIASFFIFHSKNTELLQAVTENYKKE